MDLFDQDCDRIVALIRRMVRLTYLGSKSMIKRYGLTGPQVVVLRSLLTEGQLSAAELAERMYATPSNLTGIIDRLEAKGLLRREPNLHDRRVVFLVLTEAGLKQAKQLPDPIEESVVNGLSQLDRKEVARIATTLETLVGLMGREVRFDQEGLQSESVETD